MTVPEKVQLFESFSSQNLAKDGLLDVPLVPPPGSLRFNSNGSILSNEDTEENLDIDLEVQDDQSLFIPSTPAKTATHPQGNSQKISLPSNLKSAIFLVSFQSKYIDICIANNATLWEFVVLATEIIPEAESTILQDIEIEESDTEVETVESNLESEPESPQEIAKEMSENERMENIMPLAEDQKSVPTENVLCCSIDSCKTVEESIPQTTTDCNSESNQPFWAN